MRAVQLMRSADVVLYDRLVSGGWAGVHAFSWPASLLSALLLLLTPARLPAPQAPSPRPTRSHNTHAHRPTHSLTHALHAHPRPPKLTEDILDLVHPGALLVYVGKQRGFHTRTQEEIHELLMQFAGQGVTVLR